MDSVSKLKATLASSRARLGIKQTSTRTPDKDTASNAADCVERQLRADGHTTWGFILYRCTYADDAKWQDFVDRLTYWSIKTLEVHNGADLISSMDIQVHEGPQYDGLTPEECTGFFLQWLRLAVHEHGTLGMSQRYRYFIHVDQEALESIVSGPEPPQDLHNGYVNIVRVPADAGKYLDGFEGAEMNLNYLTEDPEQSDEEVDEVEGWHEAIYMRIAYTSLMVDWYGRFRAQESWRREYVAPPEIGLRGSLYDTSRLTPRG